MQSLQFGFVQSNTHILEEPHGLSKGIIIVIIINIIIIPSITYTKGYWRPNYIIIFTSNFKSGPYVISLVVI